MVDRFVGPGGNDGNSGLTWALRKLTLNGVEDTPVVAGDDVYVGPGVYRELLTVDVSGGAGTEITYIADVTGENTDGIGGVVRITGSDNDQAPVRNFCIDANAKLYRTFRGFVLDMATQVEINAINVCTNWIMEDCWIEGWDSGGNLSCIYWNDSTSCIVRRCVLWVPRAATGIKWNLGGATSVSSTIENCLFMIGQAATGISSNKGHTIAIENNLFFGGQAGVSVLGLGVGSVTVDNNAFMFMGTGVFASILGELIEDFNTFYRCGTDRTNVNVGGDSQTYPVLLRARTQLAGLGLPSQFLALSQWSPIRALADNGAGPADDLLGIARAVTNGKRSWGAVQFVDSERETGTVRTGSVALVLHDAGRHQIIVPIDNAQTMISVWVRREANYAGNLPQMIIKQPGQADRVTVSVAAVNTWEELTDTFTPAALPPYVVVEFVSRNTAAALAFETFFDDMAIDGANVDIGTFERWISNRMFFEDNPGFATAFYVLGRGTMRGVL